MTTQRTPGPWDVDDDTEHMSVNGPDGYMVADCAIFSLRKGAPSEERCRANAYLIAAAPDLLDAIAPLAFSSPDHPPPGVKRADWGEAVFAARKAMAKARDPYTNPAEEKAT